MHVYSVLFFFTFIYHLSIPVLQVKKESKLLAGQWDNLGQDCPGSRDRKLAVASLRTHWNWASRQHGELHNERRM